MDKTRYTTVLSIAGFDPSSGAGMQADLKTISALGCYGLTVLTALPIQNTQGVQKIYSIDPSCVHDQLQALSRDCQIDAIKIGMLYQPEIIRVVIEWLSKQDHKNIVLDPVMGAKNGVSLLTADALELLQTLFPLTTLITPNLPEAALLLNQDIQDRAHMEQAAIDLSAMSGQAVLLKGGHLDGEYASDCLYIKKSQHHHWFTTDKIATTHTHGTGCTYSAAIATYLAKGFDLPQAVAHAKKYLTACIQLGAQFTLGFGNNPLHHFPNI